MTRASSGDVSDFVRVESRCYQRESLVQDDCRQAPDSVGCPQVDGQRVARPRPELRAARPAPVAQVPDGAGEHLLHLFIKNVNWAGEHILYLLTHQRELSR